MKFFTREWVGGDMPDAAAEAVVSAYRSHLEAIDLPHPVKSLAEINPHDALILSVDHDGSAESLHIRLRCGDLQAGYFDALLTFSGVTISSETLATLAQARRPAEFVILYDEVDREADAFVYRLLFHPSGEASIRFSEVDVIRTPVADRWAV